MLRSVGSKPSSYCIEEDPDLGRDLRRKGAVRYASGMEVEEMESMQEREWWRFRNGREEEEEAAGKIDEDEDDVGDQTEVGLERGGVEKDDDQKGSTGRFLTWNSSRIFRVRRGSGGKDRHSKVLTAKGLRDRRVRLSVSTAIQFYDLQDRLGYDQPSKAIEWLIKAAAHAIADLPSLDGLVFPSSPKRATDEKQLEQADPEADPTNYLQLRKQYQQQQLLSLSKSPSSSTSETSKGSVMTRSRSEIRVKARERARERTAKERVTDQESDDHIPQHNQNPSSTQSSFTDLLHGCGDFRHSSYMNYFGEGKTQLSTGFSCQPHSSLPLDAAGDHHSGYPQFSFLQDHLIPPAASAASTANGHGHNFSMSSTLAGFNRGTLQSNSTPSSFLPHLLKFSSPLVEASPNVPFFIGSSAAASTAAADNHQFLSSSFDGRLQHCYSDGCWHSDLKGKEKS